jgi:glycosyltransferase involved in cell wall biosynthesis
VPKVSVILPVFNGEETIGRAIGSIVAQTFRDFELLMFDDGSTDGSLEICERLASRDDRLRVVRTGGNVGLGAAMNGLVAAATGTYIAVQEQDDRSTPDRLRLQVQAFGSEPDAALVVGVSSWRDDHWRELERHPRLLVDGGEYPPRPVDTVRLLYVDGCLIENSTAMFRADLTRRIGSSFCETRLSSIDWQFFVEVAHEGRVVGLHYVLSEMSRGGRQHITSDQARLYADMLDCIDCLYERFGSDPRSPINRKLRRLARARVYARMARSKGSRAGWPELAKAFGLAPLSQPSRAVLSAWIDSRLRRLSERSSQ